MLYATTRNGLDLGIQPSSKKMLIKYPKLDIRDPASIRNLADSIKEDHGGLDVLINNAAVHLDLEYSPANVKKTLDINYRASLEVSCREEKSIIPTLLMLSMCDRCAKFSYLS